MPTFVTSGEIGVDLTASGADAQFSPGTLVSVNNGGIYQYVFAQSILSQYAACLITTSSKAYNATTALAVSIKPMGFAQVSIGVSCYGWVARCGANIRVKAAANCASGAQLYTTATEGVLDDAVVTAGVVVGVMSLDSISTATNLAIAAGTMAVVVERDQD